MHITALRAAVVSGNLAVARMLLKRGADMNRHFYQLLIFGTELTPLQAAAEKEDGFQMIEVFTGCWP